MALTEQRILKQFAILPAAGAVQVQWADQILRDGKLVTETYHREVVPLGSIEGFGTIAGDLPTRLQSLHDQALAVVAARDAEVRQLAQQNATLTQQKSELLAATQALDADNRALRAAKQ